MDAGQVRVVLQADARRVNCPEHGPTVTRVPWARPDAGHTSSFDDQVAWLAVRTSKAVVSLSAAEATLATAVANDPRTARPAGGSAHRWKRMVRTYRSLAAELFPDEAQRAIAPAALGGASQRRMTGEHRR